MLGFFKRDKNKKIANNSNDYTIESMALLGEKSETTGKEVKTSLHLPPNANIGQEEKYYYQFLNNELPLLKENQISLSGIEVHSKNGKVYVKAFLRNSLPKGIRLNEPVPLLLLGPSGEQLARQRFDLSVLGEIPAESSVPWLFTFDEGNVKVKEIPQTDWKLAFELSKEKKPHALDLEESWEKSLADTDKEKLAKLVKTIQPPKPGEVNFMGIQARLDNEGALHTTLLIRNGSEKNVKLEQLPLTVEDASGEVVAKGGFTFDALEIKANTSKPWAFTFPKELVLKEEIDLSKWKAYVTQG